MARDGDDAVRRRREREDEQEAEEIAKKASLGLGKPALAGSIGGDSEQLGQLIDRAESMIEQLNNLYSQYIAGAEQRPPLERRQQLDQVMMTIQLMGKPTQTMQFRASSIIQRYNVNKDRWERMIKDLENGKIKRTAGGNRA